MMERRNPMRLTQQTLKSDIPMVETEVETKAGMEISYFS